MNNKCITGLSPRGHCGSAAYCPEPHNCCAACDKDCNIRCGHLPDKKDQSEVNNIRKLAIRNALGKAIHDFCYRTGHYPAAILAEPEAFIVLLSDREAVRRDPLGEYRWGNFNLPLRKISSGERGVYLIDRLDPVLVTPKEVE